MTTCQTHARLPLDRPQTEPDHLGPPAQTRSKFEEKEKFPVKQNWLDLIARLARLQQRWSGAAIATEQHNDLLMLEMLRAEWEQRHA